MVYKLYVETVEKKDDICWSYAFYNHQNFMVYRQFGKSEEKDVRKVVLRVCAAALKYFDHSIRRRYYDEHFSTRIDEDYVTLYTEIPEIADIANNFKATNAFSIGIIGDDKTLWEELVPFFNQRTMLFETSSDNEFIEKGKDLAMKA